MITRPQLYVTFLLYGDTCKFANVICGTIPDVVSRSSSQSRFKDHRACVLVRYLVKHNCLDILAFRVN